MKLKTIIAVGILFVLPPASLIGKESPVTLPQETAALVELIDKQTGDDPQVLYRWLMESSDRQRPKEESNSAELRLAVERLMKRSRGMTQKFAVSHWDRLSYYQKEDLSAPQVTWLLELLGDESFSSLTEKDWPHKLPYRFRFSAPIGILSRCLTKQTRLIITAMDDPNPAVRAGAVSILDGRVRYRHRIDDARIAQRLIQLAGDADHGVRAAVAAAMGFIKCTDPARFVRLLRAFITDTAPRVRENALMSTRRLAVHVSADHAAELVAAIPSQSMRERQLTVSAIKLIVQQTEAATCNEMISCALPMLDTDVAGVRARLVEILAFAAVHSSAPLREQAVAALSQVISQSDEYDEMNSINNVAPLAGKLSAPTRWQLVDQLLNIIEAGGPDREIRMRQAGYAAASFVPLLDDDAKRQVTGRMLPLLRRPKKARPAAQVIGAAGPAANEAVDELIRMMSSQDPWAKLAAARALWNVQPDVERCAAVYLQVLQEGPDVARHPAQLGLLEMKQEAIAVLDDLIQLLEHERAYRHSLEVISHLGPAASKAAESVRPFLESKSLPVSAAARRALESFGTKPASPE